MNQIYADKNELARAAAELFVLKSKEAVARRGVFTVALSGGSTPKLLFEVLAEEFRDRIAWNMIQFFWSDERHVPPDHPESNYRMANEALLSRVPVPQNNIHRVHAENPNAAAAAAEYEETLIKTTGQALPELDLILLGVGTEGHTASIFPGSAVLQETKKLVAAPWVEKFQTYRITMTPPLLNNGAAIVFLVSGSEKAAIVKELLNGPEQYPAQAIKPTHGELLWMLDEEAARKIR